MKSNIMAMIPTSFALFLFFLPLVFVMKISHKDQVMKNLNDINAESLPLLMGLKSTINDLPENKLTSVISTFDELILHAQGQEQQLISLLTHYEGLLIANETAYNASALTVLNAEEALDLATTRTTDATTDLATARAAHAEALHLRNLARTDYQNSVTNHANEDLNSTITVLQNVRAIIFGLLQDQSASPTASPDVWRIAVVLNENAESVIENIGSAEFNAAFNRCPVVQYTRNGNVVAVYVRKTPPTTINAYDVFTYTWINTNNILGVDFDLYDNLDDAKLEIGAWTYCNYGDSDVGFPRDCGKDGRVGDRWFSMPGGRLTARGITAGVGFSIYIGDDCPGFQGS